MKQTLLILALFLQSFLAFTENITEKSSVADSLLIELRALPHDTTRLKLLEKLVLTEQNSPHYIEYAEEMFNEAQRQKNPNIYVAVHISKYYTTIIRMKSIVSVNW